MADIQSTRIEDRPTRRLTHLSNSAVVQRQLIDTLRLDLFGPWPGHEFAGKLLPESGPGTSPSHWHLTGFIVPSGEIPRAEALADSSEEIVDEVTSEAPIGEESADEGKMARKGYFPSSIGLSFRIHAESRELDVRVTWGATTVLVLMASLYGSGIHERPHLRYRLRKTMTLMSSTYRIPMAWRSKTSPIPSVATTAPATARSQCSRWTGGLRRLQAALNFVTGPMRSSRRWR